MTRIPLRLYLDKFAVITPFVRTLTQMALERPGRFPSVKIVRGKPVATLNQFQIELYRMMGQGHRQDLVRRK